MKGKGHKRNLKKVILKSNGLYGNGSLQPDQRIDSKVTNEKRTCQLPICNKCFQIVGKGIFHPCNNAKENLMKLVEMLPESNQQQIATTIIKNSQETCVDDELSLSTSGRKLRIILNPTEKKDIKFNEESLDNFRNITGSSINKMKIITNFIRCKVGRKSIPPNYLDHMSEKSKILKDVYKHGTYEFDCSDENTSIKQKRPVVYADAEELLDAVIEERNLVGDVIIKVMADGGQGFFKISLTILPENYSLETDTSIENTEDYVEDDNLIFNNLNNQKRTLYSEGGSMSKKNKLTSVHKLILL